MLVFALLFLGVVHACVSPSNQHIYFPLICSVQQSSTLNIAPIIFEVTLRRLFWERRFNEAGLLVSNASSSKVLAAQIARDQLEGFVFTKDDVVLDFITFVTYKWDKTKNMNRPIRFSFLDRICAVPLDEDAVIDAYLERNPGAADVIHTKGYGDEGSLKMKKDYAQWVRLAPDLIVKLLEEMHETKRLECVDAIKDLVLPEKVLSAIMNATPVFYLQYALRDSCHLRTSLRASSGSKADKTAILRQAIYNSQVSGRMLLRVFDDIRGDSSIDAEEILVEIFMAATRRTPEILEELLSTTYISDRVFAHALVSQKTLPVALGILAKHATAADIALAARFAPQSQTKVVGTSPRMAKPKLQFKIDDNLLRWAKDVHTKIEEEEIAFAASCATEAATALISSGVFDDCLFRILQREQHNEELQVKILHAVLTKGSIGAIWQFFYRSAVKDSVRVRAVHHYCSSILSTEDAFERWRIGIESVTDEDLRPATLISAVEIMGWPTFVLAAFKQDDSFLGKKCRVGHVQHVLDMLLEWCGKEAFLVALQPVLIAAAKEVETGPEPILRLMLDPNYKALLMKKERAWLRHRTEWIMTHLYAGNATRNTLHALLETAAEDVFVRVVHAANLDTLRKFIACKPRVTLLRLEFIHSQVELNHASRGFPICPWNLPVLQGSRKVSFSSASRAVLLHRTSFRRVAVPFNADHFCAIATRHLREALQSKKASADAIAALFLTGHIESFFCSTFVAGDKENLFTAFLRMKGVPNDPLSVVQAVHRIPCLLEYFCQTNRQLPEQADLQDLASYIGDNFLLATYLNELLLIACLHDDNLPLVQAIFAVYGKRFSNGLPPSMELLKLRALFRNSDIAIMRYLYHVLPESFFAPSTTSAAKNQRDSVKSSFEAEEFTERILAERRVTQCAIVDRVLEGLMSSPDCRSIILQYLLPEELHAGFISVMAVKSAPKAKENSNGIDCSAPDVISSANVAEATASALSPYKLIRDARLNSDVQLPSYHRQRRYDKLLSADQLECAKISYPFDALQDISSCHNSMESSSFLKPGSIEFVGFNIAFDNGDEQQQGSQGFDDNLKSSMKTPKKHNEGRARLPKRSATLILEDQPAGAVSIDEIALEVGPEVSTSSSDPGLPYPISRQPAAISPLAVGSEGVIVAKQRRKKPKTLGMKTPTKKKIIGPAQALSNSDDERSPLRPKHMNDDLLHSSPLKINGKRSRSRSPDEE